MSHVADELIQYAPLRRVGDSAVLGQEQCIGANLIPRQVNQLHLSQFPTVDGDWVVLYCAGQFVADSDNRIDAFVAGDLDIAVDLVGLQSSVGRLHFNERLPCPLPAQNSNDPVRSVGIFVVSERHFDESLYRARRRAASRRDYPPELSYHGHDGQQGGCGASFLFFTAADTRHRKQSRPLPVRCVVGGDGRTPVSGHSRRTGRSTN